MNNRFTKPSKLDLSHSLEQQKINAAFFGRFFGMGDDAKINITAIFILFLLVSAVVFSFCFKFESSVEYWKIVSPFVTLGLGYIWGRK